MSSLPTTGHEHHHRIREHVDRWPALADMLETRPIAGDFAPRFREEHAFITGTLQPHIAVVEKTVYPELERLLQNRHSMAPMRREHEELARLVESMGQYSAHVESGRLSMTDALGLRRVLYRMYALVKVHIVEEQEYLRVLQGNLSAEEQEALARGLEHVSNQSV
jgi:hypothetical protein